MDPHPHGSATSLDDAGQQFVLWTLATLKLPFERRGASTYVVTVPEEHRQALGGATVTFCFERNGRGGSEDAECLTFDSRLFGWLIDQLQTPGAVQHAAPAAQPARVHEIAQQILAVYEVEGGGVHLSGCTLEDRPFLRLTYLERPADGGSAAQLEHCFFTVAGEEVDDQLRRSLGFDRLEPIAGHLPRLTDAELQRWIRAIPANGRGEWIATTVLWCKHADGKIAFAVGDVVAEQRFSGWAQQLVDGAQKPPPFVCPQTGLSSYRLAATDDGRISVAEAIGVCAESGRRVLRKDLETCSVTAKEAVADFFGSCPVTRQRLLRSAMAACAMCGQDVSPASLEDGQCGACRALQPVRKDDPRMARVLGEYPKLDRWNRWRMAETATAYVLVASATFRRLLVVVEKEGLELLRIAIGSRLSRQWSQAPLSEREEYLK